MALIKTIDELKKSVRINRSFDISVLESVIADAERDFIIPVISEEEYNRLDAAYNADPETTSAAQKKLIALVQRALGKFAIMLYLPTGQLQISDSGVHIISNEDQKTAFQWQLKDAQKSYLNQGFAAIEPIYDFLEANSSIFDLWKASNSYSFYKESFINTAKEFTQYVDVVKGSRRLFLSTKATIRRIEEFQVKPVLGAALYQEIKDQIVSGAITPANKTLLNYIKPAVAHLSFAKSVIDNVLTIDENGITVYNASPSLTVDAIKPAAANFLSSMQRGSEDDGKLYLKLLFDYLEANASTYNLYTPVVRTEIDNNQKGLFIL